MKDCIFCKIVKKELESAIIYEDDNFLAFLDNRPNTKGMTLVITKEHYSSYVFDLPDRVYLELLKTSKKVAKILEKGLNVKRVAMVFEGQGVNHIHTKLYPLHKVNVNKFGDLSGGNYFKEYPGYITTLVGPPKSIEELNRVAKEIRRK